MSIEAPSAPQTEPVTTGSLSTFLSELLLEQQRLQTPVARFAALHEHGLASPSSRSLIPLTAPKPGEQYAFQVDLDACSGCKACVSACHSLNGLDENETWRDVGLIHGGTTAAPYQQTITTACHHCADPGCLNGCPVLAYEKDPITGIVRHLDDQCIGCQYCVLKCPYDVPKYNERLGIVRKCDMCHSRLAVGEAPACAQACPTHAIRIVTILTESAGTDFLPAAPSPKYTRPTTRYVSSRTLPDNVTAADVASNRPQPPHWPLVVMLTLLPMAVGCAVTALFSEVQREFLSSASWLAGALGLGASVFHLGKPLRAWRVFLGLRKSWLSREAVIFGLWFSLATPLVMSRWIQELGISLPTNRLSLASAIIGTVGLFCSIMIYVDTHREFWRFAQTAPRFVGSAIVLALTALFIAAPSSHSALLLATAVALKLIFELGSLLPLARADKAATSKRKTALLLVGPLRSASVIRAASGLLGALVLAPQVATNTVPLPLAWVAGALVFSGEIAERYLFFRAVVAPKMPGVPTA